VRKALLVVALIAAAFGGGAFVNGPGLILAKKYITTHWGGGFINLGGQEIVKAEEDAPKADDDPFAAPSVTLQPKTEGATDQTADISSRTPLGDQERPLANQLDPPKATSDSTERAQVGFPAARGVEPKRDLDSPPSIPPEISFPRGAPALEPPNSETPVKGSELSKGNKTGWHDAPDSAPAKAVLPRPATPPLLGESNTRRGQDNGDALPKDLAAKHASLATETPSSSSESARRSAETPSYSFKEWSDLRKRMKQVGVSRYWIEAEPAGSVRFRCIIPLAGTRAVAQQFEAEGEDEFQAADAALRRVALWRATEP
jgi:hypothetical protein